MNRSVRPLVVIYATVALDAMGLGLVFPILPRLLAEVTRADNVAAWIGILSALYAVMQFVFAPTLGALSDRIGRRPVLLVSLAGAALNYVVMAFAPQLWMLLVGRVVAGLTGANMAVASAYVADVSREDQRARRFGLFNAVFGVGFIVGPVLGGLLGDWWVRAPFVAAALLNAANLLLACFVLPESRPPGCEPFDLAALNPLRPLRWAASAKSLWRVTALFFLLSASGEVFGTCWALFCQDAFQWNGLWTGLSLAAFGLCQAVSQALLAGAAVKRLGERRAILVGLAAASVALAVLAFASQGSTVFAAMPVFAIAGIGIPALQALGARLAGEGSQGRFQGVVAAVISLASIVAPLVFSSLYFAVRPQWPGAIWLCVGAVYALAVPLVLGLGGSRVAAAPVR